MEGGRRRGGGMRAGLDEGLGVIFFFKAGLYLSESCSRPVSCALPLPAREALSSSWSMPISELVPAS